MELTISPKNRVTIPKAARDKMGLVRGQKMRIKSVTSTTITYELVTL